MTHKARPSDDAIRERLREGHFTAARSADIEAADPIASTPMVVDVEDIDTYDRNPRQTANPAFDAIKMSILEGGLQHPLVITRRPGAERYMVLRGGNTRLEAIQTLYGETGDPHFRAIHCLFEPWTGESVALLGHLIENDTRGDLTFLDRARAITTLKALFEQELDAYLSQRHLATLLKERGYRISPILISQMAYALSELAPLLPQAFQAGLGGDRVQRIRALDHAGEAVWQHAEPGASENYRKLFRDVLASSDATAWRFEIVQQALIKRLAKHIGTKAEEIEAMLNAELTANGPSAGKATVVLSSSSSSPSSAPEAAAIEATMARVGGATPTKAFAGSDKNIERTVQPARVHLPKAHSDEPPAGYPSADLKSLRSRAWTLASKLARRYRIDHLIQPLPQTGLGYSVTNVIDPKILAKQDDANAGETGTLWWHLVACAELTSAPSCALQPILQADGILLDALKNDDLVRLLDAVPTYHISQLAAALWSRMDERGWRDLVALMETYRQLHHVAAGQGVALWEGEDSS